MRKKNPTTFPPNPIGQVVGRSSRRNGGDWVFRSGVTGKRAASFKRYISTVESGVLNRDFDHEERRSLRELGIWETEY